MILHRFTQGDELPRIIDDDPAWWTNIQQYGAAVALSAAITFTSSLAQSSAAQHQDDPAGNTSATVDEYFWQDPVQHFTTYVPLRLFIADDLIVPQPAMVFQPDEYFWQNPVTSYVTYTQWLPPQMLISEDTVTQQVVVAMVYDPNVKLGREGSMTMTPTLGGGSMRSN